MPCIQDEHPWTVDMDIHRCPKKTSTFIFLITLSKINRFQWFLVCEILTKFDIESLYTCPPYLYTVTTFPWEIQKSHFSTVLLIETSDYNIISEETNCNCCTAAYLFTYCCLLLPIICVALFCGQFFYLFGQSFSKPPMPTCSFQSHQHLEERNIICSQM